MKFIKKHFFNIVFIIVIGLMIYPPTKVYFIRLISFSPSVTSVENQKTIENLNWNLKGLNAPNINLMDKESKVVFISFWATWCPPCIAEMPSMKALYADYKDRVEFIFVTNEDWKTVSEFYTKKGYDFPTYNELTSTPEELYSKSIPATFILNKKKQIVVEKYGAANWNSTSTRTLLETLLK